MKDCSIEAVPMDGQEKRIREGEQREATEVRIVLHTRLHGQTEISEAHRRSTVKFYIFRVDCGRFSVEAAA